MCTYLPLFWLYIFKTFVKIFLSNNFSLFLTSLKGKLLYPWYPTNNGYSIYNGKCDWLSWQKYHWNLELNWYLTVYEVDEKNSGLIPFSITLKVSNSNMKISELFGWDVIGSLMGIWWVFPCSNLEATTDWSWPRKIDASPDTKRAPNMLKFFVLKRPIVHEAQNHSNIYAPPAQLFSTF